MISSADFDGAIDVAGVGVVGADFVYLGTGLSELPDDVGVMDEVGVVDDVDGVRSCGDCGAEIGVAADVFKDAFSAQSVANGLLVDADRLHEEFAAGGVDLGVLLAVEVFGSEEWFDPQNRVAVDQ